MKTNDLISPEILKTYFTYDPETGIIIRIKGSIRRNGILTRKGVGKPAGTLDRNGYLRTSIIHDGIQVRLSNHRLAWTLYYGKYPTSILDHKNRIGSDNWIKNLREATYSQNSSNSARCEHDMVGLSQRAMKGKSGLWWRVEVQSGNIIKRTNRRKLEDAIKFRDYWKQKLS